MARCWLDFHDTNKTVFLAGCGRSGTTWLGDVLNYRNTFRVMFEPFFPVEVPELAAAGWRAHGYLRPGATGPCVEAVERILAGRIRNAWIDQFNRRPVASRRLIKDIRANFMLGWLRARYPDLPIVFLMRHPIPTVFSQLKMGWKPAYHQFRSQPELLADFLAPYQADLDIVRDDFGARMTMWCMLNLVPLRQFAAGGLHVVFYEDLCRCPEEILPALLAYIGVRHADGVAHQLKLPSIMTQHFSAIRQGGDPVDNWRTQATPEQMNTALTILTRFGFDRIYNDSALPRVDAAQVPGLFKA